ncbi:MAG TPA: hypothetical protein VLM89_10855 [Phycisphaerae bacterium]|nr:hypothetical protein [Phycisphaerae bacterium]
MPAPHKVLSGLLGLLAVSLGAGCNTVPAEKYQDTQRNLLLAQEKVRSLEQQLAEEQQLSRQLQGQMTRLRGLSRPEMLDELVTPVRIRLAKLSGGYNSDGQAGDDGLVLYVQPVDRDGHVIKAAGTIKITILDPLCPPNRNVVAEYKFDVPTTRKMWYGRLMTSHFTVRCPWPTGQVPIHDELIAHVVFVDMLTGRMVTTVKSFKILLPPVIKGEKPVVRE